MCSLDRHVRVLALGLTLVGGCTSGTAPAGAPDLDRIFRPATASEIATIEGEWAARTPIAAQVVEELTLPLQLAGGSWSARVLSHVVDGHRHYGVAVIPRATPPEGLPVLLYAHPGDRGVGWLDVTVLLALLGERSSDFIIVAPSFRSETLDLGAVQFTSEGPASPWDRDVDDTLALLDVALREIPEADPERVGALGVSRGAGVALLAAIREPRIRLVVAFSGPTDFFDAYAREVVAEALQGRPRELPGLAVLSERFVQPLAAGSLPEEEFRLELARRSAVLFAARLPAVQLHHGTGDAVVAVTQAERLRSALQALSRSAIGDEVYLYEGAGHNPLELIGSAGRTISFLERLLPTEVVGEGG